MAAELQAKEAAVSNFREYLRIKTVHPKPDIGGKSYVKLLLRAPFHQTSAIYDLPPLYVEGAIAFLKRQAADIGLECNVVEVGVR